MRKNSKQVLVLIIVVFALMFAALPLTVHAANSGMKLNVEVFDANGNKYASGEIPEIEFVIRDKSNKVVATATSNSQGSLKNAVLGLQEDEAYYLDVSDSTIEKGFFFYFDNTENKVWNGEDFYSEQQDNQETGISGLTFKCKVTVK